MDFFSLQYSKTPSSRFGKDTSLSHERANYKIRVKTIRSCTMVSFLLDLFKAKLTILIVKFR